MMVRTDLALEARENIGEGADQVRGVTVSEYSIPELDIRVTRVNVDTKNGAKIIGKPMGTYVTLEVPNLREPDSGYHEEISHVIAEHLREMLPIGKGGMSVLVVGLGNRDVTADSLGPKVVDHLRITRHILDRFGAAAYAGRTMSRVSAIAPGVMARTGMEAEEVIRGIVVQTEPNAVLVIDALAARSTKRLNRTIQISNTGIHPGSGVGNHRNALTEESLGVPVIAIGIPTVVDAGTIVSDALERSGRSIEIDPATWTSELHNFYVTGKDIDEIVHLVSYTLSEAINEALQSEWLQS